MLSFSNSTSFAAKQTGDGALKKECKRVVKQLSKDGWHVFGGKETLPAALESHYQQLGDSQGTMMTIIGRGTGPSLEAAKRRAETDATKQYATMNSTTVSSVTSIDIDNSTVNGQATTQQQVHHGFRTSTQQLVSGLQSTVYLSRDIEGDDVEVMAYYLVSKQ